MNPIDYRQLLSALQTQAHSRARNYAIPGLTSYLLSQPSAERGCLRLFHCEREHFEAITPHSHRFAFQAVVLKGNVANFVWTERIVEGDHFVATKLIYGGTPGEYRTTTPGRAQLWGAARQNYTEGETYAMRAEEVHSIFFSRNTWVLMIEGPQETDTTTILEPFVEGVGHVKTFKVEDWMFRRDAA